MSPSCHSDVSITRIKQDLSGDWPISPLVTLTWIGPYGGISSPHQPPMMMTLASRASLSPTGIITSIAGQERKAQERTSFLKNYGALPSLLPHLVLKVRETEKASGPSQEESERVGGRRDAQDRNNQEFTSPQRCFIPPPG